MIQKIDKKKSNLSFKVLITAIIIAVSSYLMALPSPIHAQTAFNLPGAGVMLQPTAEFQPALIKGIKLFPNDPLRFNFGSSH